MIKNSNHYKGLKKKKEEEEFTVFQNVFLLVMVT